MRTFLGGFGGHSARLSAALAALLLVAPLVATGADAQPAGRITAPRRSAARAPAEVVELFAGMESGDIEVTVIPKDSTQATVTVKNKTAKPLTIKVPPALAGVPVQAQFGGGGGMMGGMQGGGGMMGGGMGGMNQGMGGGMMGGGGGMMGGGGGMMGGGGMFNVAPEKVAKVKIVTVCLDHGKKDPNPRVPYKLIPVESYAKSAEVAEVLKLMTSGQLDQHSAQAAVWHLQNGLSWDELATKIGAKHLNGSVEPYFTSQHLERAFRATKIATELAKKEGGSKTPAVSIGKQAAN
jgi:hypothetical protein